VVPLQGTFAHIDVVVTSYFKSETSWWRKG
jgi:hypothetical protein